MKNPTPMTAVAVASFLLATATGLIWWCEDQRPIASAPQPENRVPSRTSSDPDNEDRAIPAPELPTAIRVEDIAIQEDGYIIVEGRIAQARHPQHKIDNADQFERILESTDELALTDPEVPEGPAHQQRFVLRTRPRHSYSTYPFDALRVDIPLDTGFDVPVWMAPAQLEELELRPREPHLPSGWRLLTTYREATEPARKPAQSARLQNPLFAIELRRDIAGLLVSLVSPLVFVLGVLFAILWGITPPRPARRERQLPYGWAIASCSVLALITILLHRSIDASTEGNGAFFLQSITAIADLAIVAVATTACISCRIPTVARTIYWPLVLGGMASLSAYSLEGWQRPPTPTDAASLFGGDLVWPLLAAGALVTVWAVRKAIPTRAATKPQALQALVHYVTNNRSLCGSQSTERTQEIDAVTCGECQRSLYEQTTVPKPLDNWAQ